MPRSIRSLLLVAIVALPSACDFNITGLPDTIEIPVDSTVVSGAVTETGLQIDSGRTRVELRSDSAVDRGLMAVDHVDRLEYRVAATCYADWIRFIHPDGREAWVEIPPPCGSRRIDHDFAQEIQ